MQDLRNGRQDIGLDALLGRAGAIVLMIVEYEGALIRSGFFLHIQKYIFLQQNYANLYQMNDNDKFLTESDKCFPDGKSLICKKTSDKHNETERILQKS